MRRELGLTIDQALAFEKRHGERYQVVYKPGLVYEHIDLNLDNPILADRRVLKVFHACRQDLEIFHILGGRVPAPVFDTQIAAMVCGHGEEVAYDTLVAHAGAAGLVAEQRLEEDEARELAVDLAYTLAKKAYKL
jgi:ribonuclease D